MKKQVEKQFFIGLAAVYAALLIFIFIPGRAKNVDIPNEKTITFTDPGEFSIVLPPGFPTPKKETTYVDTPSGKFETIQYEAITNTNIIVIHCTVLNEKTLKNKSIDNILDDTVKENVNAAKGENLKINTITHKNKYPGRYATFEIVERQINKPTSRVYVTLQVIMVNQRNYRIMYFSENQNNKQGLVIIDSFTPIVK